MLSIYLGQMEEAIYYPPAYLIIRMMMSGSQIP